MDHHQLMLETQSRVNILRGQLRTELENYIKNSNADNYTELLTHVGILVRRYPNYYNTENILRNELNNYTDVKDRWHDSNVLKPNYFRILCMNLLPVYNADNEDYLKHFLSFFQNATENPRTVDRQVQMEQRLERIERIVLQTNAITIAIGEEQGRQTEQLDTVENAVSDIKDMSKPK